MGSLKLGRKVLCFLLLFVLFFQMFSVSLAQTVSAEGSNSRVQANIQWGQKKSFQDMNADDLGQLTYDDLRMIGVFLSNFYVPYSTAVGKSTSEDTVKEDMVNALVDQCNFNKDVAAALVPMVWQMVLDTAKPLNIGRIEGNDDLMTGNIEISDDKLEFELGGVSDNENAKKVGIVESTDGDNLRASLLTFFIYTSGRTNSDNNIDSSIGGSATSVPDGVAMDVDDAARSRLHGRNIDNTAASTKYGTNASDKTISANGGNCIDSSGYKSYGLYWVDESDGNKRKVVWSNTVGNNDSESNIFTASSLVYGMLCDNLNYNAGYAGNSLFSIDADKALDELSEQQKENVFVSNAYLYVDCFGDIFVDNGENQYIVLPACENPFAWYKYDEGTQSAGKYVNLANMFMLGEIADKHLTYDANDVKSKANASNDMKGGKAYYSDSNDVVYYYGGAGAAKLNSNGSTGDSDSTDESSSEESSTEESSKDDSSKDASDKSSSDYDLPSAGTTISHILPTYNVYMGKEGSSLFQTSYWRVSRGDSRTKLDENFGFWANDKNLEDLRDAVCNGDTDIFVKIGSGGEQYAFPDWNTFMENLVDGEDADTKKGDYYQVCDYGLDPRMYKGAFQDIAVIDNIGSFQKSGTKAIKTMKIFNDDGTMVASAFSGYNNFSSIDQDNIVTKLKGSAAKQYVLSLYLSYVFAYYDERSGADRVVSWAYNKDAFPSDTENIDWSNVSIESDALQNELMSLIYYIVHPTEGIQIVKTWFKNKVSAILVGWHEDMVGASNGVATSGSTKYIGFSGYVTIPNLSDLAWTDWLLSQYDTMVVYFIILIVVVMLGYVMVGSLTLQRAITGIVIFSVCAYLPPKMIDFTVNASNMACDKIYSSKFTYWALAQHYQYQSDLKDAVSSENEQQYLATIFTSQAANAANDYAIVSLKWQCPKKDNYTQNVKKEVEEVAGNSNIFKLISGLVSSQISGESYVDTANNLYLYRSYTDIATYGNALYDSSAVFLNSLFTSGEARDYVRDGIGDATDLTDYNKQVRNDLEIYLSQNLTANISNGYDYNDISLASGLNYGFLFDTSGASCVDFPIRNFRHIILPLGSKQLQEVLKTGLSRVDKANLDDGTFNTNDLKANCIRENAAGLKQSAYNNTVANLNSQSNLQYGTTKYSDISATGNSPDVLKGIIGNFAFGLYTESPYYYLSFNLKDQLDMFRTSERFTQATAYGSNAASSYKDLFLMKDGGYFYNMDKDNDGYGEMRDFMDMRSLFSAVIPYLRAMNNIVIEWDNTQGLWMYDDVDLEYDSDNRLVLPTEISKLESDLGYKYWHNANVAQLLNIYTPWVDTMLSCDYAKPENIYVAGKKFRVEDPINPESYYGSGRPMVFSRSEMAFYGLKEDDLTQVELKIIKMYDAVYESLLTLMDYYNFGDDVMNTGAAMLETFEFNKQFSEKNAFGEDYMLYPQSYELKNFSYDAFLRLIMAETTGEDIAASYDEDGSMYMTVVKNSSILTGIMFILVDMIACYAIPALKLFFLLLIFALSVIMILCATVKLDISLPRVLWRSLVSPLLKFLCVTIGLALFVSLFMSNGNTAVTGRGGFTISLGDPVMVLIVMIVANAGALYLYFKIVRKVLSDCITYGKAVAQSVSGMAGGLLAMGVAGAMAGKRAVTAESVGANLGGTTPNARGTNNVSRHANAVGGHGGSGSGGGFRESRRAASASRAAERSAAETAKKQSTQKSSEKSRNHYNRKIEENKKKNPSSNSDSARKDMFKQKTKSPGLSERTHDTARKNVEKMQGGLTEVVSTVAKTTSKKSTGSKSKVGTKPTRPSSSQLRPSSPKAKSVNKSKRSRNK